MKKKYLWLAAVVVLVSGGVFAFREGDKYFKMTKSLDQMAAVYRDLNTYYVDSLDPYTLMEAGIEAMTQSLDPYTVFFPEEKVKQLEFEKTGEYAGIGASFRMIHDSVFISSIFPHAPFDRAGLNTGDIILSLDGQEVTGMSPKEVHRLLRGAKNSKIEVSVKQPWTGKIIRKKIKRRMVQIPAVTYQKVLDNNVGYLRFRQFTRGSSASFKTAFTALKKENPHLSGLIIDLRNNPGGLLREAVRISNFFLPKGDTIVSVKGRSRRWNKVYTATKHPLDTTISIVVLINGHTASAAEILSGAMQDLDRGVIVGQPSFGKGLVQGTRKLPYDGRLKLTVGRYYTPSGRCIQAIDYTHENPYGNPVYIPDSLKRTFRTATGRIVTDQGGIAPDEVVEQDALDGLMSALVNENIFFRFATSYAFHQSDIPELNGFAVGDRLFQDFESFVNKQSFQYQSKEERWLTRLKADAVSRGYYDAIKNDYDTLQRAVHRHTHPSLASHKAEIKRFLAKNIMNCYYGDAGQIATQVPFDSVVQKAAAILDNKRKYSAILK